MNPHRTLCALAFLAAVPALAQIDQLYTSSGGGDWTVTGNWTQGTGADVPDYPIAGDWVSIGAHTRSFSADEAFGNATSNSFWNNTGGFGSSDVDMNGNTWSLTNNGTFIFDGNDCRLQDGTFLNTPGATFVHDASTTLYVMTGPITFRNQGTLRVENSGLLQLLNGPAIFIHESGATIGRTNSGQGRISSGTGYIHAHGGSIFEASSGAIIDVDVGISGFVSNAICRGAGTVEFNGNFDLLSCSREAGSTVTIAMDESPIVQAGGMMFDVSDANGNIDGLLWNKAGNATISTASGNAINRGVFTMRASGGWMKPTIGGGEFVNDTGGTFRNDHPTTTYQEGTFRNKGTYEFLANQSVQLFTGSASFINESGGLVRKTGGTASFGGSGDDTFDNAGTLRVDATTVSSMLTVSSAIGTTPQFSGNTLSGGTWQVIAASNTATLNYDSADAGISTIDTGAEVLLSGANATFSELSAASLTVSGALGIHDQQVYAPGGLSADGILDFGLEAADAGGSLKTGINVGGDVDFSGGTVTVSNRGDMVLGTYRIIEWTGAETGTLTMGTKTIDDFRILLNQNNGGNYVELTVVPIDFHGMSIKVF